MFTLEDGTPKSKIFFGESEGEALEHFDCWASQFNQILEVESVEEVEE